MSDGIDIRGGGAVAVDTETLRSAAGRFRAVVAELEEIGVLLGSAGSLLFAGSHIAWWVSQTVEAVRRRLLDAQRAADRIAADLEEAAAVYETVELRAERDVASRGGDVVALVRLQRELAELARLHPEAADAADTAIAEHWARWPAELSAQAPGALWWVNPAFFALAGPTAWGMQRVIGAAGRGSIERAETLRGPVPTVTVTPVVEGAAQPLSGAAASPASVAPASLAGAASRIPGGGGARIRVEKYSMRDGTSQFAVYVAGTQTASAGGQDPFDMTSNVQLYAGERSASYEATLEALAQSGAEAGDVVHAFGHSQGAMILAHLALEGGYDTQTIVTYGSPVEADLGDQTLSVALRHRDDPIAALAAGGSAGSVGSAGSFVAERAADPATGMHDWRMPAHGIAAYTETARMLDESTDPRMREVRAVFDTLAGAQRVEVVEYAAQRDMPVSAPLAPGPVSAASPASADAG
ncbi:MAG: hypothetical protein ABW091_03835 [Microbacterium sp.]